MRAGCGDRKCTDVGLPTSSSVVRVITPLADNFDLSRKVPVSQPSMSSAHFDAAFRALNFARAFKIAASSKSSSVAPGTAAADQSAPTSGSDNIALRRSGRMRTNESPTRCQGCPCA